MVELHDALRAWGTDAFAPTLKRAIEGLPAGALPLDRATASGGRGDDSDLTATVISAADRGAVVAARVGIFFSEIIAGCSCGDDPFAEPAYCELEVRIDKATGAAEVALGPA